MVSSLTGLAISAGGDSGGMGDQSKANQESQGLNVWGEKSESISKSSLSVNSIILIFIIEYKMQQLIGEIQT